MSNETATIFQEAYTDNLIEVVEHIVFHDDYENALKLYHVLNPALTENKDELRLQPQLNRFYSEAMLKLKFICLPALEGREIIDLVTKNFCFQFRLPDYDLLKKIKAKLGGLIEIEERNNFKDQVREALLNNNEKITAKSEKKTVAEWIRDYIAKVGLENKDKLATAQYLVSLKGDNSISDKEIKRLSLLFKTYEKMSLPSDSPAGFEEEFAFSIDGKLFIFRQGILEPVEKIREVSAPVTPKQSAKVKKNTPTEITPRVSEEERNILELEKVLFGYQESSLEYKAIKQEISRLKSAQLRELKKNNDASI